MSPDGWTKIRKSPEEPEEQKPLTLPLQADNWYQFCTYRQAEYDSRGEKTAAMVYWAMRFWVELNPTEDFLDPTTDEGFKEVGEYLSYKMETVPHAFG